MLYKAKLPKRVKQQLTRIVVLQMRVLECAATSYTLTEDQLTHWLRRPSVSDQTVAEVVNWILRPGSRREMLETFASGPENEKIGWAGMLRADVANFYRNPVGQLSRVDPEGAPAWKQSGADWLREFYDLWRRG